MEENIAVHELEAASPAEASPAQDFEALLRDRGFQSEFDRRVSRALETARGKWAQETERKIQQARAAAEARARMTGEERIAHDFAERMKQLDARESALQQRELHADALRLLQERGLPVELVGAVNCESAQRLSESMDAAEKAFLAAVQAGVEKRMRGEGPALVPRKIVPTQESDADYYARLQPKRK